MGSLVRANSAYIDLMSDIIYCGTNCTCRGYKTREIIQNPSLIDMNFPLVTLPERRLGYRFCCAEAAWIMSGDNRVKTIQKYAKMIKNFSDDGSYFFGAYGPKIVDQLPYIIKSFSKDIYTRQAVIQIWRERPYETRDVPCTISVQFLYRDGLLHCIDNMRSSDAWLGVPYDWFNFSMLAAGVALLLRNKLGLHEIKLGNLYFTAGSQHIYLDKESFGYDLEDAMAVSNSPGDVNKYQPIDLSDFSDYDHLVETLWTRADRGYTTTPWLSELNQLGGKR